ncbi:MAG: glycoside hydrolase family 9 protein [Bacteroidia bacterium]|jgi:hypothetical protein|nr:glycoside hydrolase family 9 protein [Bacteroidia bacterium]
MRHFLVLTALAAGPLLCAQTTDSRLHIDQLGYRINAQKVCVVASPQTGYNAPASYTPGTTLEVRNSSTNFTVFSAAPVVWNNGATDTQSGDKAWWFDFSAVTTPGSYYIFDAANNTRSYEFRIAADVYNDMLMHATRTFYYQRCGFAKNATHAGAHYTDGVCHHGALQDLNCRSVTAPNNAALELDLSGGWHDAGDYNKYTNFVNAPAHYLLDAYQQNTAVFADNWNIPESGNSIPDILDELKYELDWLLKMQLPNGSALMKVSTAGFQSASPPSTDVAQRFYGGPASSATRSIAGIFAHAAIVYKSLPDAAMQTYGDTLLARAVHAWNWLQANPGYSNYANTGFGSANPEVSNYDQDALSFTAAVYLFAATGNAAYRTYVDNNYAQIHALQWTFWYPFESNYQNALLYYTQTPGATTSVVNAIESNCTQSVSTNNSELLPAWQNAADPYRAFLSSQNYTWGCNQFKCESASIFYNMLVYALDAPNQPAYRNAAESYVHFMHGVNATGFTFLTNADTCGADTPIRSIYHGWFGDGTQYDDVPAYIGPPPGYLPGGINQYYQPDAAYTGPPISPPQNQPVQKCYKDWNTSWPENSWEISENAIYTQAAYIKLLACFADSALSTANPLSIAEKGPIQLAGNGTTFTLLANPAEIYQLQITDMAGRVVWAGQVSAGQMFDFSALSPAVYIFGVQNSRGEQTAGRFVVQY